MYIHLPKIEGATLIEVATTISIIAIGLSLAMPSWEQSSNKRDLTSAAEQLTAFLSNVQNVAIRRNENVTVSLSHNHATDWCIGAVVGDSACDCTITNAADPAYCAIENAAQMLRHDDFAFTEMTAHSPDTDFTFEPVRGLMVNADLGTQHFFNLESQNGTLGLQISILPSGRVRACNFDNSRPVPGYANCS